MLFVPEVRDPAPTIRVVGDEYCLPYLVDLSVKKQFGFSSINIDVLDDNGTLLLQVDGGLWRFNKKRTIRDPLGAPIVTLRTKTISWQEKWKVHRGDSSDAGSLLYTVRKSRTFQLKTQLEVFLASNRTREICDFRVVGSYTSQSFKVYRGDTLIAEVREKFKLGIIRQGSFEARIYPGVDYAFIISLLVIHNEVDSD